MGYEAITSLYMYSAVFLTSDLDFTHLNKLITYDTENTVSSLLYHQIGLLKSLHVILPTSSAIALQ